MKWQYFLYRFADARPDLEGDAGARSLSRVDSGKLMKNSSSKIRRRARAYRGLKIAEALAASGQ